MNAPSALLSALVVAALAACANGRPSIAEESAEPRVPPAAAAVAGLTDEERAVADLAVQALAADLAIPPERIRVDKVRAVEWRDSSLGCPRTGMAYLDVVTPGHQILLFADGQAHVVHEAGNRAFVCRQSGLSAGPTAAGNELGFGRQWQIARKDLAGRLRVPEGEIRMQGVERMTWRDASLGCPEPGVQYAGAVTDGWVLTLRHGERDYRYHADADRAVPCPGIATQ